MAEQKNETAPRQLSDEQAAEVTGGGRLFDDFSKAIGVTKKCARCGGTGKADSGEYEVIDTGVPNIGVKSPVKVTCPICEGTGIQPNVIQM